MEFSRRCSGSKETLLSILGLEPEASLPAFISKTIPGSGCRNLCAPALRNPLLPPRPRALPLRPAIGPRPRPAVTEHNPIVHRGWCGADLSRRADPPPFCQAGVAEGGGEKREGSSKVTRMAPLSSSSPTGLSFLPACLHRLLAGLLPAWETGSLRFLPPSLPHPKCLQIATPQTISDLL